MTLRFTLLVTFIIFATAAWSWCGPHRDRYETAPYKVVSTDGKVEIREYPPLKLVTAKMGEAKDNEANRSFRSLFAYISGENAASSKIAMTTPVFMDESNMSFVLPEDVTESGAPSPTGTAVALTQFAGGRFAVLRFKGSRSDRAEENAEAALRAWAAAKKLRITGSAMFAYYDPPFTLPPLRRNEVLLAIE